MAVVPMQKVAVLALASEQEPLIQVLHEEGVLEITDARESPSNIDHTEVNFRIADLEYVIGSLKNVASKKTIAAMKKNAENASVAEVMRAVNGTDVLAIQKRLHELEGEDKKFEADAEGRSVAEAPLAATGADQPVYLTSGSDFNASRTGGAGDNRTNLTPRERASREKARKKLSLNAIEREKLSEKLPDLVLLRRYMRWLGQKQAAREAMRKTKSTVMLGGWVPQHRFGHLEKTLRQKIPDAAVVPLEEGDEQPPVELKNNPLLTPFESVTKLYGLPKYHEMDPTPHLSLFFILFFALCLTDAGYGAVQAIVTGIALLKLKKTPKQNPLLWLLFLSGIVTVAVSIPFGGWFGLSPDQAPSFMTEMRADGKMWFKGQIWNLGEQAGIGFLQNLSIALGVIHLSFGIVLSAAWKMRNGEFAAATWQDITTLAVIGAILARVLGPAEFRQISTYAIYTSLVLMIWGKGYGSPLIKRPFMGILQTLNWFLGMMGNVLSYLRILALGLVTGALAFTVNLVAEQIGALLPWFMVIPFMIVVYVVGHAMNIALNVLGAFIHSGRLQFVEFFSQFFEGGGRPFKPFART